MSQINIAFNKTLFRKSSLYEYDKLYVSDLPLILKYKRKNEMQNKIKRSLQICSDNRDITIYPDPYNFVVNIDNNNTYIDSNGKTQYIEPRIQTMIPNMHSINLNKLIIPKLTMINRTQMNMAISPYTIINTFILSNIPLIILNSTYYLNTINTYITIVNFYMNGSNMNKINFIMNYDINTVYNFNYNDAMTILQSVYMLSINTDFNTKFQKILHLHIHELDDNYAHSTTNNSATFRIFPKSLKGQYLHANTNNIIKLYDKIPRKITKLKISIKDDTDTPIKTMYLDYNIQKQTIKCNCYENMNDIDYSCSCKYLLHPYNPIYQIYLFFYMEFIYMTPYDNTNLLT